MKFLYQFYLQQLLFLFSICYCFVIVLQVLVWKTNFDQLDFSEVLQSHKNRQEETSPSEPTVSDIPPRVTRKPAKPKSPRGVSITRTGLVGYSLFHVSSHCTVKKKKKLMHVLPYNLQDIYTLSLFIYIYDIKKYLYLKPNYYKNVLFALICK